MNKGYKFESETDTEVVIKLVKYLYDKHKNENIGFQKLIEMACSQLVLIDLMFNNKSSIYIYYYRKVLLHYCLKVYIIQVNYVLHGNFHMRENKFNTNILMTILLVVEAQWLLVSNVLIN